MPDKKATGAKPEDTPALVLDCQRRITSAYASLENQQDEFIENFRRNPETQLFPVDSNPADVGELKDAKSGLVEAKGRVKCAKDVLDYTNKIKRYILTAKIKGGKCHS
ncbi:hypothetical protein QC761_507415 [Podospora bellae-mahoneyi]|uniref:Uncharacterized protein n=1 Tax=Podospora bellae-mahoneyi TaxID=2093777 RepID=A0ABR0FDX2_9PEZI|nr:hypothetical protein QC761_507415 [Podospora bellae-mahoneyi]